MKPMQDDVITPASTPPRRASAVRTALYAALPAFLAGAALVGVLVWNGAIGSGGNETAAGPVPTASTSAQGKGVPTDIGTVENRLSLIEQKLARIDLQAEAASGNATRAEGLLIAFAARRLVERGAPLGYIEQQLKLRFADSQPNAVQTLVDMSRNPVTLDQLATQLRDLGPVLGAAADNEGGWEKVRREFSGLFVIHRDKPGIDSPGNRLERARIMLLAGRTNEAIAEVERLPGSEAAAPWIADARRYQRARQALDLIETAAMHDPRELADDRGQKVNQPSPLVPPAK